MILFTLNSLNYFRNKIHIKNYGDKMFNTPIMHYPPPPHPHTHSPSKAGLTIDPVKKNTRYLKAKSPDTLKQNHQIP